MIEIPYGYCMCGCGQKTEVHASTHRNRGEIKGEPRKFINGHQQLLLPKIDVEVRFWSKVNITANDDLCWEWQGWRDKDGYGAIRTGGRYEKRIKAHRLAWSYPNYVIPEDMLICHSCDNPSCCNPKHLFLGTHQDNMDDMVSKGRSCKKQ